tara:strand:- start:107 stop:688 length:582 start_codon:yes stop_codon:yes gene_type:complete
MDNLESLRKIIISKWETNLKSFGVKCPSGRKLDALACLYSKFKKPMSQDEITQWFIKKNLNYDKQARHIASDGWDIRSGNKRFSQGIIDPNLNYNELILFSVTKPNPNWDKNNLKRINNLSLNEWDEILKHFKDRGCAVCGRKREMYDRGHLDRSKPYNKGNIVPMCSDCNNWGQAKNLDFKLTKGLIARPIL